MNNLLTVNGLSKTYYSKNGETMAVDNISFDSCGRRLKRASARITRNSDQNRHVIVVRF